IMDIVHLMHPQHLIFGFELFGYAGADHIRRTMDESSGTSPTPSQTYSNRKNKSVFGIGILCRLGAKMHFAAVKSMTRNQEHFRCFNFKFGRGRCTVHFILDVLLEKMCFKQPAAWRIL
ncbi:MAG: hypothetical protein ACI3YH_03500, partial [Eubacteriales bacterium]